MRLKALLGFEKPFEEAAFALYGAIVAQARQPYFYSQLGVPDTLEGRFDMIILHAFLLFHRLKDDSEEAKELSQVVFDTMFQDLDQSLREMGVGDMGVGPRIKKMASSFYGRVGAYDKALAEEDNKELEAVIARNVFNKLQPEDLVLKHLATYVRNNSAALKALGTKQILAGKLSYANPDDLT